MKEATITISEQLERNKEKLKTANPEDVDELNDEIGTLETILDDNGDFSITLKKFNMKEHTILEEIAMGIRGG